MRFQHTLPRLLALLWFATLLSGCGSKSATPTPVTPTFPSTPTVPAPTFTAAPLPTTPLPTFTPYPSPTPYLGFAGWLDANLPALMERHQVAGVAVALIHDGELAWSQGYGFADRAAGIPVTPDTIFQVASISKSVSAWGVMRLVETGKLVVDAPVGQYLTRWQLPPSEFDHGEVTIYRLLSHTAGLSLPSYAGFESGQLLPSLEESLSGTTGDEDGVRVILEPGSEYSYSGGGYTVLQLVIEEVSGETFADFMRREVLEPLQMEHSGFEWTPEMQALTATAYDADGQPLPNYLFTAQAAAGLYATAPDLARFVAAGLPGSGSEQAGQDVLLPETIELMYQPAPATNGGYGLGYSSYTLLDGTRVVYHGGHNRGWEARFEAAPEKGTGIVILTNSDAGADLIMDVINVWENCVVICGCF